VPDVHLVWKLEVFECDNLSVKAHFVRSHFLSMKSPNGGSSAFGRGHGDEPKTARVTVEVINRDIDLRNVAIGGKQLHQISFRRHRSQVVYIDFGIHDS
jgi:hypothetical protein